MTQIDELLHWFAQDFGNEIIDKDTYQYILRTINNYKAKNLPQPDVSINEAIQPENKKGEVAVAFAEEHFKNHLQPDWDMPLTQHIELHEAWKKELIDGYVAGFNKAKATGC